MLAFCEGVLICLLFYAYTIYLIVSYVMLR